MTDRKKTQAIVFRNGLGLGLMVQEPAILLMAWEGIAVDALHRIYLIHNEGSLLSDNINALRRPSAPPFETFDLLRVLSTTEPGGYSVTNQSSLLQGKPAEIE